MPTKTFPGITVAYFYETYREKLHLELVTKEVDLDRLIREGSINRPSLALTGFLNISPTSAFRFSARRK